MNSMELVRYVSSGARPRRNPEQRSAPHFCTELEGPARSAILRARQYLIGEQRGDGLWLGTQSADATLASLMIFWLAYAGREDSELAQQCAATILEQQAPTGGWSLAPGGSADVSTSVQAYLALKLLGIDPSSESLVRARQIIRQLGGADATDGATRFILALFGQINYDHCPADPPERLLFQAHCGQRGPLSIIWSHRPVRDVGLERGVRELFVEQPRDWPRSKNSRPRGTTAAVLRPALAFAWQKLEHSGWSPLRRRAIDRIESQIAKQVDEDRIGELRFDELIWHAIALQAIGFAPDSGELRSCENRLREMVSVDDDANTASPQFAPQPLPDTALVVRSLLASGMSPNHDSIASAIDALCGASQWATLPPRTMDLCGVLSVFNSATDCPSDQGVLPPGIEICWDWPDDDRAAQVETNCGIEYATRAGEAIERLLQHQNPDGGWGDRGPSRIGRCKSAPDITGAVLEALHDREADDVRFAIHRAVKYLRSSQRADGSWIGGSITERIRATSLAIRGLLSAGVSSEDDAIAAGVNWFIVHQQADGGWDESSQAAEHLSHDQAAASATAWALLALVAAGKANHPAACRGVNFLLEMQGDTGCWSEPNFALHDAATNRWVRNHLHSVAWPLLALSQWAVAAISAQSAAADEMSLRLVGVSAAD